MKKIFALLVVSVLIAGCTGGGPSEKKEAYGAFPELGIEGVWYEPDELYAGELFQINATVRNLGGGAEDRLRDVEGEFYNFGPYLERCMTFSGGRHNLQKGEPVVFSCQSMVKPLSKWNDRQVESFSQDVKFKASYYYDLALTMEGLTAYEEKEFDRLNPKQGTEKMSAGNPFSMELLADGIPAREGDTFRIVLRFSVKSSETEGLEEMGINTPYHIGLASVSIPSHLKVLDQGDFDTKRPCGEFTCLEASFIRLEDGKGGLNAEIMVPRMTQPEDSFNLKAFATGFKLFRISGTTVRGNSEKLS